HVDALTEPVNRLKIAGALFDPGQTVVAFCNPMLLRETLLGLTNQAYIKICGDGTYRLTEGEWALLSLGVLSKRYSRADGVDAFRTTFSPLVFGLASKESRATYQVLMEALCACAQRFADVNLRDKCKQYHADMHAGEDLAQKSIFTNACRVLDWAHLIGACNRPAKLPETADEKIKAFRSGAFATAGKHLRPAGQKLALQRYYFTTLSADEARHGCGCNDWPGDPAFIFLADWWCGIQRLQPGSASGTQAQESWHRHKLKSYLGLRASLPSFAGSLDAFSRSRLTDLQEQGSCLPDMPMEPFPDKTVLWDSERLTRDGRTSAHQFSRTRAWDRWEGADGTVFYCMRRTLATYNHATKCWVQTADDSIRRPSLGSAAAFAALLQADSTAAVDQALLDLDLASSLSDLEALLKLFDTYVVVGVGAFATRFWRQRSASGQVNPHHQGFCSFCSEFCIHATCEHLHTAFIDMQMISLQRPEFPQRQRPVPLFEQEPIHILLPATARSAARQAGPPVPALSLPRQNSALTAFLQAHRWNVWDAPLQQQQVSVLQLATVDFADLRCALPSLPAGLLFNMKAAAKKWLADKALLLHAQADFLVC
ncbi:unnamed protein product, partial [Effrenium voratum]